MSPRLALVAMVLLAIAGSTETLAQAPKAGATIVTPPSVDNGVANGVVKRSGAPSVGNGRANGVVKTPGAPSVDDGEANGIAKPSTVRQ